MNVTILSPTTFEAEHYEAVGRLLGQLTTRNITFTPDDYQQIITSPCSKFFLLLHDNNVAGMLTLGMYVSPTGSKGWIEDVVIDAVLRGNGFGRILIEHAINYCKEVGIGTIYLTSNPKRVAANALYQSVGFTRKETNMYKMDLKK